MGRAPCCDKANVKKGPWSPEEDAKLKEYIDKYGTGGNWIALPQKVGLRRCGKSCRLRWLNYLRPNIKHGEFSDEEDRIIINLFANIGSRWSIIAAQLPGRTDNDIKNYWNTKLKKKLMGIINQQPGDQIRKPHHPVTNNPIISSSSPPSSSYGSHYSSAGLGVSLSTITTASTDFEPMSSLISSMSLSSSTSSSTNTNSNYSTNYGGSSFLQHQVTTAPMQHNINSGLIMFGSGGDQASCSSSDHNYHNNGVISVLNHDDHMASQKGMISNGNFVNGWAMSDQGSNSFLEYGLEEIKQLISSNCNQNNNNMNNFLFDENKTDHERVLYYYNY